MSDENDSAYRFTVAREGPANGAEPSQMFVLKVGAKTPVRIGRAPGNDILVESRGVSQYHAELRYLQQDSLTDPSLCVRDLSMNGTGLKRPDGKALYLEKWADVPLQNGSVLLIPMLLKVSQLEEDRVWLRVSLEGPVKGARSPTPAPLPHHISEARSLNGRGTPDVGGGDEEDEEGCRLRFVELLWKTREVSAATTYGEAKKLLRSSGDWYAVNAATRKECFEIFVKHLRSHHSLEKKGKKKKKKKDKSEKDKSKSKKQGRLCERGEHPGASNKEAQLVTIPMPKGHLHSEQRSQGHSGREASCSVNTDHRRRYEKRALLHSWNCGADYSLSGSPSYPRNNKRCHRDYNLGSHDNAVYIEER